jgi:hypothetical protein
MSQRVRLLTIVRLRHFICEGEDISRGHLPSMENSLMSPRRIYECLEHRLALAGDIAAAVVNGDLQITGDDANNAIEVHQVSNGDFRLIGINTRINGERTIVISDDVTSIHVDLAAGRDSLNLSRAAIAGDLGVSASGGDNISLQRLEVGGATDIALSAENDHLAIGRVTFEGDTNIDLGDGSNNVLASRIATSGDLNVVGGIGNDRVSFSRLTGGGSFAADLDNGNDLLHLSRAELESLAVTGGTGLDTAIIDRVMADMSATVDMGEGRDRLVVTRSSFAGGINITPDDLDTVIKHRVEGVSNADSSTNTMAAAAKIRQEAPALNVVSRQQQNALPSTTEGTKFTVSEERNEALTKLLGWNWNQPGVNGLK